MPADDRPHAETPPREDPLAGTARMLAARSGFPGASARPVEYRFSRTPAGVERRGRTLMASTRLRPGDKFLDRFDVLRELGRGYTGTVHEVLNLFTRLGYALKVMHEPNEHQVSRLSVEASSLIQLDHEHVVRIHDAGQLPDGRGWLLMELLKGSTLADLLAKQGALSPLLAIRYILGIAWGVAAAHEQGIIHRDLKPANVFITDGKKVAKVLDFSGAKYLHSDLRTTKPPDMTGTIAYMSPQQIDGETADGRMDVYALGLIFYELLTGESPFQRLLKNIHALAVAQAAEMPPRIAEKLGLPACFDEVIQRATRKEAKDRYQTPAAFAQAVLVCKSELLAGVAASVYVLEKRPGEPSLHDTNSRQEYQAPQPLARPDTAPVAPAERITTSPRTRQGNERRPDRPEPCPSRRSAGQRRQRRPRRRVTAPRLRATRPPTVSRGARRRPPSHATPPLPPAPTTAGGGSGWPGRAPLEGGTGARDRAGALGRRCRCRAGQRSVAPGRVSGSRGGDQHGADRGLVGP